MATLPGSRPRRPTPLKEHTVCVVDNEYNAYDIIKAVGDAVGPGHLLACIKLNGLWQITLNGKESTEKLLENGIRVNGDVADIQGLIKNLLTVSFFGVPAYMEDDVIIRKLEQFGCVIRGRVIRKFYKDEPSIENGTRFVRVEIPATIKSLPYAVRFESDGPYIRLLHTNQHKVCNHCLDDTHLIHECPDYQCKKCHHYGHTERRCSDFTCYKCRQPGHRASECTAIVSDQDHFDLLDQYQQEIEEDETTQTSINTMTEPHDRDARFEGYGSYFHE